MRHLLFALLCATPALADPPVIRDATASRSETGWRFSVTLAHPDTGWDHYADGWRVETAEGAVLGTRELAHPHVTEQPFTRSLGGVTIPETLDQVVIRARCNIDGWSGETFTLSLD